MGFHQPNQAVPFQVVVPECFDDLFCVGPIVLMPQRKPQIIAIERFRERQMRQGVPRGMIPDVGLELLPSGRIRQLAIQLLEHRNTEIVGVEPQLQMGLARVTLRGNLSRRNVARSVDGWVCTNGTHKLIQEARIEQRAIEPQIDDP